MYLWALLPADTAEAPHVRGVSDDLARVMRLTERYVLEEQCFLCYIVEVRHVMTVVSMDASYAPTGRAWIGRRNNRRGVTWQETQIPADPPAEPAGDAPGWEACDSGSSQSPSRAPAMRRSGGWPPPRKPSDSTDSSAPTTS